MNKLNIIILSLLMVVAFSCRQEDDLVPTKVSTFLKMKGNDTYHLLAVDAKEDFSDGGLFILANAVDIDNNITHPLVIKTDQNGVTIWQKIIENIAQTSYSLEVTADNKFILSGEVIENSKKALSIIVLTSNGDYEQQYIITDAIRARSSIYQSGNKLVVVGEAPGVDDGPWTTVRPVTLTIDLSNDQLLNYGRMEGEKNEIINRSFTVDAGYVHFAVTDPNSNGSQLVKARVGETTAASSPIIPQSNQVFDVKGLAHYSSGNFCMIGNQNDDFYYTFGNTKDAIQTSQFVEVLKNTIASSVAIHPNGILVVGSSTLSNGQPGDIDYIQNKGEEDFYLALLKYDGTKIFQKSFGGEASDMVKTVLALQDGGIFMLGDTEFGDVRTLLLIKTDEIGELY